MVINCNDFATKANIYLLEETPWIKETLNIAMVTATKINPSADNVCRENAYTGIVNYYSFDTSIGPFNVHTNAKLLHCNVISYDDYLRPEFKLNLNSYHLQDVIKEDSPLAIKVVFTPSTWFIDRKIIGQIATLAKDDAVADLDTNKDPHSFDLELIPNRDRQWRKLATPISDRALKTIFNDLLTEEDKFLIKKELMDKILNEDQ